MKVFLAALAGALVARVVADLIAEAVSDQWPPARHPFSGR